MRAMIAVAVLTAAMFAAAGARAEKRVFIIAGTADGYGVDQCLSSGAACGKVVANSYCHSREFTQAVSFHKVGRDDITGAIPATGPGACHGHSCDNFVAIECSR